MTRKRDPAEKLADDLLTDKASGIKCRYLFRDSGKQQIRFRAIGREVILALIHRHYPKKPTHRRKGITK